MSHKYQMKNFSPSLKMKDDTKEMSDKMEKQK